MKLTEIVFPLFNITLTRKLLEETFISIWSINGSGTPPFWLLQPEDYYCPLHRFIHDSSLYFTRGWKELSDGGATRESHSRYLQVGSLLGSVLLQALAFTYFRVKTSSALQFSGLSSIMHGEAMDCIFQIGFEGITSPHFSSNALRSGRCYSLHYPSPKNHKVTSLTYDNFIMYNRNEACCKQFRYDFLNRKVL